MFFLTEHGTVSGSRAVARGRQWAVGGAIRNPKSGILNRKSGIRNPESEIRNRKSGIGNPESEIRNRKSGIGNPESEIRNPKSGIGNPESEIRNPKSIQLLNSHFRAGTKGCMTTHTTVYQVFVTVFGLIGRSGQEFVERFQVSLSHRLIGR
jgi:hypothetical protein